MHQLFLDRGSIKLLSNFLNAAKSHRPRNNSVLVFILAQIGGLLGLYVGFTLLSVVEFIYFIFIRPCCPDKLKDEDPIEDQQDLPVLSKQQILDETINNSIKQILDPTTLVKKQNVSLK